MESQTESPTADDSDVQLPDWLVGVIVVIIILIMAVIILIITTFVKNRRKSRSNMFSAPVGDDLESGKIAHNIDSTMMTSLTSIPNSINDSTLLARPVALSPDYDLQADAPASADVIYGLLGCRNPLFVDDEVAPEDTNNNRGQALATRVEADCVDHASGDTEAPSTSWGYREYDATIQIRSQKMPVKYGQDPRTSLSLAKNKQTADVGRFDGDEFELKERNVIDTNHQLEWETNETSACGSEKRDGQCAAGADGSRLVGADTADKGVQPGSGRSSLSSSTASSNGLSDADNDVIARCPQNGSHLEVECPLGDEAAGFTSKHVHFIKPQCLAATDARGCGHGGAGPTLSRSAVSSEDPHCSGAEIGSDPDKELGVWAHTGGPELGTADSCATRADRLSHSHACAQDTAASPGGSLKATSTFAASTLTSAGVTPTCAVPTSAVDIPTPGVPTCAVGMPTLAAPSSAVDITSSAVPMSTVDMPTLDVPTSAVDIPTPGVLNCAVDMPTAAVAKSPPDVVMSTPLALTSSASAPSSLAAQSTPGEVMSAAAEAVPTHTLPVPSPTWVTPTSATVASTPDAKSTVTSTPDAKSTVTSTPDEATVVSTPDTKTTVVSTPDTKATVTSTPETKATVVSTPDNKATVTSTSDKTTVASTSDKATVASTSDKATVASTPDNKATVASTPDNKATTQPEAAESDRCSGKDEVNNGDDSYIVSQRGSTDILTESLSPVSAVAATSQNRQLNLINSEDFATTLGATSQTPPVTSDGHTSQTPPVTSDGHTSQTPPVTSHGHTSQTPPVTSDGDTSQTPPVTSDGHTSQTPPVTSDGDTSQTPPVTSDGHTSQTPPVTSDGHTSQTPPVTSDGHTSQTPPVTSDGHTSQTPPVTSDGHTSQTPPVTSDGHTSQTPPVTGPASDVDHVGQQTTDNADIFNVHL
ncbi:hypothetical protein BsWGS_03188 [Bradybaena similaris]